MLSSKDIKAHNELQRKIGTWKCPICGNKQLRPLDGFSDIVFTSFNPEHRKVKIPVVSIGCENCGFISHHALGALGLLNMASEAKRAKND